MSQGLDILVLGTGTFAEEIADVVSQVPNLRVVGYVANMDRPNMPKEVGGKPVHWIDELPSLVGRHRVVCGLGTTRRHCFTDQAQQLGAQFVTPTHPSAHLSPTSQLGEGSIASVNVIVAAHTKIGRHVVLNRGAMVGHHTVVDDFVTVGPGANIAGNCRIGRGV